MILPFHQGDAATELRQLELLTPAEQAVMQAIGEPMTPTEIGEVLGKKKSAVWMCIQRMVTKGRLVNTGAGRYWFAYPEIDGAEE